MVRKRKKLNDLQKAMMMLMIVAIL